MNFSRMVFARPSLISKYREPSLPQPTYEKTTSSSHPHNDPTPARVIQSTTNEVIEIHINLSSTVSYYCGLSLEILGNVKIFLIKIRYSVNHFHAFVTSNTVFREAYPLPRPYILNFFFPSKSIGRFTTFWIWRHDTSCTLSRRQYRPTYSQQISP